MGKCKKRTLHKAKETYFMTREMAVNEIFKMVSKAHKEDFNIQKATDTVSLFGISAEELSEAGVPYEYLKALDSSLS